MALNNVSGGHALRIGIGTMILAILLLASSVSALSNPGGGSWQYYKDITLNNGGSALSNYQVLINLTGSDFPVNVNTTGADIRFTGSSGNELNYWIEKWDYSGSSALIWVKIPAVPSGSSTIRMFYGNSRAISSSNGISVFEFFEDFEGSYNSSWIIGAGSGANPTVSTDRNYTGSYSLKSPSGIAPNGKYLTKTDTNYGTNIAVDVEFYDPKSDTTTSNMFFADDGVNVSGVGVGATQGITTVYTKRIGDTWSATPITRSSGWHKFSTHSSSSGTEIFIDNTSVGSNTASINVSRLFLGGPWVGSIVTNYYYDTVRIRKYMSSEPTAAVGIEQNSPTNVYVDAAYTDGSAGGYYFGYDAFNTVQDGVNAVASGGTVNVAAGTYTEQIDIAKGLTLTGAGEGITIIGSPAILDTKFTTSTANKPVIYVNNTIGVTLQQLTVDGAGLGNSNYRMEGIAFYNAGGTVDHVTISGIRETPLSGNQHGVALYANNVDGTPRTLIATNNTINDYQKNGMALNGAGLTATVTDNTVTGAGNTPLTAQNGIQIGYGTGGTISYNTVIGNSCSHIGDCDQDPANSATADGAAGILLYLPGSASIEVKNNTLTGNQFGIWTVGATSINLHDNNITGASGTGIAIWDSDQWSSGSEIGTTGSITNNNLTSNSYGLLVRDYTPGGAVPDVVAHFNNIFGNSLYGAWSNVTLNATYNWWGSDTGPGPVGPGSGDHVSNNVLYDPWIPPRPPAIDYYLPFLYQRADNLYDAGVQVQNNGTTDASIKIQFYDLSGNPAGNSTFTVKPGELLTKHAFDITGTIPAYVGPAVVESNISVQVQGYIKTVNEGVYSIAPSFTNTATSAYIPFLYQRADNLYDAGVMAFNPGDKAANVTINLYYLNGTLAASNITQVDPKAEISKYVFDIVTGQSIFVGPAEILSDQPIVAQGFIRTKASMIYSIAPSVSTTVLNAYIPFLYQRADNLYDAGVMAFNPGSVPANVTINMYYLNGTLAASNTTKVDPRAEVSKYAFDIVTGESLFVGPAEIISDQPITAQGFIRTKASMVYSIAPQVRKPESAGEAHVPFLYQTVSASHDAGIMAMNPNTETANIDIALYYPNGTKAGNISATVGSNAELSKYVFDIAPNGMDFDGSAIITADQPIVSQGFIRKKSTMIYSIAPPMER